MKNRIKEIRKLSPYGKTQETFASFLGIPKQNLSSYEIGRRNPSDAVVQLICQKCGINREWLLTGTGKMNIEDSQEERYSKNIAKLQRTDNETIMRWANAIAETNPDTLVEFEKFLKTLLGIKKEPEQ